jgi:ATP-binding cassette subfamily B protein
VHAVHLGQKPERPARPGTLRRISRYFRPYKGRVSVVIFLVLLTAGLGVLNPLFLKQIIDQGIIGKSLYYLTLYTVLMVIVPIVTGLIGVGQTYLNNVVGQRVMRDLRNDLYRHLQAMSMRFFSGTRTGEIQSRIANDVGGVQDVITNTGTNILSNLAIFISTVIAMVILSWQLTVLTFILLPGFLYITYRVGMIRREISKATQVSMANISALVEESLSVSGVLLTKTFGRQQQSVERFTNENQRLADLELRQQMVGRWFFMLISTFFSISPALVYYVAGRLMFNGTYNQNIVGTLVAFTTLQSRVFFPIGQLLQVQVQIQGALALFDRIFEYLDLPIELSNKPGAVTLDPEEARGDVKFDHVSFMYDSDSGKHAVYDVSFEALPGKLLALVGASGAGKTTITYLADRLYDVSEGSVHIDGIDVRDVTLESLAGLIGMVSQETYLFHSTIRENLLFAKPDASDTDLWRAIRAANIQQKIKELPEGLDTVVGERGYRLSGGEKQRLAIARVVLKDPKILILDEATSALDTHSERLIQAALEPLMEGRTTIAIAHRLSTILRADQILMMEQGRIVERGTHGQLLSFGGAYARLYHEQFADGRVEALCEDGVVEAAS